MSVTITESGVGIKSIDIIIFFALKIFIGFFSVANGSVKETVKDEEFEPYLQQAPHQVSKAKRVTLAICQNYHLFCI